MPRIKDQAICIRLFDWSETSQVVGLLTEQHGKVRGLAKGSKRTSPGSVARFSGGIELLTLGQVVASIKPSSDLATITEWDLQETWRHFRTDLAAQRLGLYAVDLAGAMLADHDAHPGAYAALRDGLTDLADPAGRPRALLRFQWRLLLDCGFRPELWHDVISGQDLGEPSAYVFDAHAGGLTLRDAGAGDLTGPGPWRVRPETVRVLRGLAADPSLPVAPAAQGETAPACDPAAVDRANRLLCVYARAVLDRELPTAEFVLGRGA
jgi:DNA repair protein RecO (recombination protein O)